MRHSIPYFFLTISLFLLVSATSCDRNQRRPGDIEFLRLERVMMDTPSDQIEAELAKFRDDFPSPLLTLLPDDSAFMAMVFDFRCDPTINSLDTAVKQRYNSMGAFERELTDALDRAMKLDNEIQFTHFATFIGSSGYSSRVTADRQSQSLLIAIDQYTMPQMAKFNYFGDPLYIVRLSDSSYISSDCMATIATEFIAMPEEPFSVLDLMIAEGKKHFFLEKTLTHTPDSIRFRYTKNQMDWMEANEKNVWSYLLQNKLLYETDNMRYHNLVDDAPKTNSFGDESAPRTIEYIGWQIVKKYVKKTGVSMKELFDETDSQKILSQSHYRP